MLFGFEIVATSKILRALDQLGKQIMAALENLRTEVGETKTVMGSAVTLLDGLNQKLKDAIASGDPAQIQALSDELDASTNQLAEAITRNTPAEGEPTPGG